MQSDFYKSFVGFRRAVDSVFNNRDSRSGKLIKPHDVEGLRSTLADDIYFNQTPLSVSLNASEIRQMEYGRTYSHQKKEVEKENKTKKNLKKKLACLHT
jgi:hypothetical protein